MSDLIERVRIAAKVLRDLGGQSALAATVEEAAGALEAAQEGACVKLVTDIRWACGDRGRRMQPELVEFIRELAKDAERLDWLEGTARSSGIFLYNGVDAKRERQTAVGLGLRPGKLDRDLRQAIDQARGKGGIS